MGKGDNNKTEKPTITITRASLYVLKQYDSKVKVNEKSAVLLLRRRRRRRRNKLHVNLRSVAV